MRISIREMKTIMGLLLLTNGCGIMASNEPVIIVKRILGDITSLITGQDMVDAALKLTNDERARKIIERRRQYEESPAKAAQEKMQGVENNKQHRLEVSEPVDAQTLVWTKPAVQGLSFLDMQDIWKGSDDYLAAREQYLIKSGKAVQSQPQPQVSQPQYQQPQLPQLHQPQQNYQQYLV